MRPALQSAIPWFSKARVSADNGTCSSCFRGCFGALTLRGVHVGMFFSFSLKLNLAVRLGQGHVLPQLEGLVILVSYEKKTEGVRAQEAVVADCTYFFSVEDDFEA